MILPLLLLKTNNTTIAANLALITKRTLADVSSTLLSSINYTKRTYRSTRTTINISSDYSSKENKNIKPIPSSRLKQILKLYFNIISKKT